MDNTDAVLGYIPTAIVDRMPWSDIWAVNAARKTVTLLSSTSKSAAEKQFSTSLSTFLREIRERKVFRVLDGWREELYPIYNKDKSLIMSIERSASPLFGVVTYGVHMTGYIKDAHGIKIWTPRRSKNKQTYPGMIDNTVAGGLSTGEQPFECLIREAAEEASLPKDIVRKGAKACGTLTYFHVRDARAGGETGLCQPECQYLYDLELPSDVIPEPGDNEATDFQLLTVEKVQEAMANGLFKPNCALMLLEFFVRHGILTPEDEPDYIEIVARLHRKLEFPTA